MTALVIEPISSSNWDKPQALGLHVRVLGSIFTPAVILAAGHSLRLGRPKALVEVNGKELVRWVHERLVSEGCRPVVVVNGAVSYTHLPLPTKLLV